MKFSTHSMYCGQPIETVIPKIICFDREKWHSEEYLHWNYEIKMFQFEEWKPKSFRIYQYNLWFYRYLNERTLLFSHLCMQFKILVMNMRCLWFLKQSIFFSRKNVLCYSPHHICNTLVDNLNFMALLNGFGMKMHKNLRIICNNSGIKTKERKKTVWKKMNKIELLTILDVHFH